MLSMKIDVLLDDRLLVDKTAYLRYAVDRERRYEGGPPPPPSFIRPDDLAALMTGAHAPK
jgi:hypothetical protein